LKISQFNSSGSGRRIVKSTIVVEVSDSEKYIFLIVILAISIKVVIIYPIPIQYIGITPVLVYLEIEPSVKVFLSLDKPFFELPQIIVDKVGKKFTY
jgi:hypothetical protein